MPHGIRHERSSTLSARPGVTLVAADLSNPTSLAPHLEGVHGVLLYAPHHASPAAIAEVLRAGGVGLVAVLSTYDVTRDEPFVRFNREHHGAFEDAVARALVAGGLADPAYTLSGPQSLTQREQVGILASALGREVRVEGVGREAGRAHLATIVPPAYVELLIAQWEFEQQGTALVTDAVERITGRPATTYAAWAARNAERF